ncbi:MAG: isochorismate synthase [Actinomycetota bacterium]|nr:isochorismate synthase [Actinomycetota bacterium]
MTRTGLALASRTRLLPDAVDPLGALGPGGFAWFTDELALATSGVAARLDAGEVDEVLAAIRSEDELGLPGTGPLAVGALGFHGTATLVIPARIVGRTADGRSWVTEVGPGDPSAAGWPPVTLDMAGRGARPDRRAWQVAVEEVLDRIAIGGLEKVVLAREVSVQADHAFDIQEVLARLRAENRRSFTYAAGAFVGASPELLLRRRGRHVVSKPMAGTVARGDSRSDDDRLVATMAASPKEQAEHRLVVGEVSRALAALCGDVVAEQAEVVRLPTVAHLATTIRGTLRNGFASALGVAALLHPTPAVAGVPRQAALDAIAELEPFDRGLYAGPVGWVDARGDGDWALALRGATLDGNRARLVAGAGIVAGSDPSAEWAETEAKLEAMRSVLLGAR